jgi:TP901 family phage tail tape measure protein
MASSTHGIRAGRAYVELFADASKLARGLKLAERQLREFGGRVQALGLRVASLGGAVLAPMGLATRTFQGFDDVMLSVKAVTGATGKQFDALTGQAKLLGRTTSFTAAQVASAMLELGRAGFAPEEIQAAIAPVLNLARATGTDLAQATGYAANTLRSFGLDASEMTRVADVLTATANNSAQTLDDLAQGMVYAAPIAAEYGLTLEETAKAFGALANFGIKASTAGTNIRNILLRMADPTIQKRLKGVGVTVADAAGKMRPIAAILRDLGAATENMPDVERLALLQDVFGMRAVAGGSKLTTAEFDRLNDAIDEAAGTADRTARIMDSGLGGALRRMWSAVEGIAIAIGNALSKPLSIVADLMATISNYVTEWIDKHKALVVIIGALAGLLVGVGTGLVGLGLATKLAAFAMSGLLEICKMFSAVMSGVIATLGALLSPIGLVAGAVVALAAAFVYSSGTAGKAVTWLGQRFGDLKSDAITAWQAIADAYAKGDLGLAAKIAWLTVKMEWAKGIHAIQGMWLKFKFGFLKIAHGAFYGALAAWEYVKNAIVIGMIEASSAAIKAWNVFVSWWKRAINGVAGALGRAFSKVMGIFNKDWNHQAFMAEFSQALKSDNAEITRELAAQNAAVEQRRQQMRSAAQGDHEDRLEEIAQGYIRAGDKLDQAHTNQLDQIAENLTKARKQWQDAVAESKAATQEAKEGAARSKRPGGPNVPDLSALGGVREAMTAAMGTFSGLAAGRMGVGGISQKLVDASVETAKNTRDILREVEDGGTFT